MDFVSNTSLKTELSDVLCSLSGEFVANYENVALSFEGFLAVLEKLDVVSLDLKLEPLSDFIAPDVL